MLGLSLLHVGVAGSVLRYHYRQPGGLDLEGVACALMFLAIGAYYLLQFKKEWQQAGKSSSNVDHTGVLVHGRRIPWPDIIDLRMEQSLGQARAVLTVRQADADGRPEDLQLDAAVFDWEAVQSIRKELEKRWRR